MFGGGSRPLVFLKRCPGRTIGFGSASWTCPDQTGASLCLGVARGPSDGALVASNLEQLDKLDLLEAPGAPGGP